MFDRKPKDNGASDPEDEVDVREARRNLLQGTPQKVEDSAKEPTSDKMMDALLNAKDNIEKAVRQCDYYGESDLYVRAALSSINDAISQEEKR